VKSAPANRAILDRVDLLAADIGRLRRRSCRSDESWPGGYLVDRLAANLQSLDLMLRPSAAELAAGAAPGDGIAVTEAIAAVDARARELARLLGEVER
jgi:hypothetical protein